MASERIAPWQAPRRERARLRAVVLGLGGLLGWRPCEVIAFSEALTRRPWRRSGRAELEAVRDEYLAQLRAIRAKAAKRKAQAAERARADTGGRDDAHRD